MVTSGRFQLYADNDDFIYSMLFDNSGKSLGFSAERGRIIPWLRALDLLEVGKTRKRDRDANRSSLWGVGVISIRAVEPGYRS